MCCSYEPQLARARTGRGSAGHHISPRLDASLSYVLYFSYIRREERASMNIFEIRDEIIGDILGEVGQDA